MAKSKRYMETSKGYNRAAHKAATMTVVEQDYYEELHDHDTGVDLFRVSDEERAAAASSDSTSRQDGQPSPAQPGQPAEDEQEEKKPGLIGRLFGALRKLG